ncbi:MAG: hypothetical protein CME15_01840 [Gemmatimonadetes bacterium]|nr:hypothetical protein [Gemmatimonadota bacterium]
MSEFKTEDLGHGFQHHGVASPISNHRGTVATVDGEGRNVVLLWLFDHRGGYALLMIDAETGESEEFPMPFPQKGDCPFTSILSSRNRFYTHFNEYFTEFDPEKRSFTFSEQTVPRMAMGMTEDDDGGIWAVSYPDSGVMRYDPESGQFRDFGHVYKQNWPQYQRHVAADDAGWLYFAVGSTACQIIAVDPDSGEARPVLAEEERRQGSSYVYRDLDGKVYGLAVSPATDDGWYRFHRGEWQKIGADHQKREKPIITESQSLFHTAFPDGSTLKRCDLVDGVVAVEDPAGAVRQATFQYTSEGAHLMGLATAPDGTICGGTAFPMRFFSYHPRRDEWTNRACYIQWNTVACGGDRFFVGGYTGGFLLEWDPAREWVATEKDNPESNPRFLTQCAPTINRPHMLLAHPDGETLVLAGTPGYGYTGGGLLFWNRKTGEETVLEHSDLIPEQSTMSLVPLPGGKLLGGTTVAPGTGGEQKATAAELYVMDESSKQLDWRSVVFSGVSEYTDMCPGPDGLVYGFTDRKRFFVFDSRQRQVVHEEETEGEFGVTTYQQGPRVFIRGPGGEIYVLFVKGIARVDVDTHGIEMLAESPLPVGPGGDILDGRIYFASGSHLYSYGLGT